MDIPVPAVYALLESVPGAHEVPFHFNTCPLVEGAVLDTELPDNLFAFHCAVVFCAAILVPLTVIPVPPV